MATYATDLNGNRIETAASATAKDGTVTDLRRSMNGREVPIEQSEEKVLRQDSSGTVRERIVKKYNQNGTLSSTERVLIEETKLPDGGSSIRSTSYKSDINGNQVPAERKTTETHTSGSVTTSATVVDRPSINGSFETSEKRNITTETTPDGKRETESVLRPSGNGGFYEALRAVNTETKSGNEVTDQTAYYEPGLTSQLSLARQNVTKTITNPDGSKTTEVDLYARSADGHLQENGAAPQIKERQIIEQTKRADGSVVQTLSVQRPTISDPNRLGGVQKISETVCRGDCGQSSNKP